MSRVNAKIVLLLILASVSVYGQALRDSLNVYVPSPRGHAIKLNSLIPSSGWITVDTTGTTWTVTVGVHSYTIGIPSSRIAMLDRANTWTGLQSFNDTAWAPILQTDHLYFTHGIRELYGADYGIVWQDSLRNMKTIYVWDTEHTGAIRDNIVRALSVVPQDGYIVLPPGRYNCDGGLMAITKKNVHVIGHGTTLVFTDTSSSQPATGFYAVSQTGLQFVGIHFVGTMGTNQVGIWLRNTSRSTVEKCAFDSLGYGGVVLANTNETSMSSDSGSSYNTVRSCTFQYIKRSWGVTGVCVFISGASNHNIVTGNTMRNGYIGVSADDGTTGTTTFARSKFNEISLNSMKDMVQYGINSEGSPATNIVSNQIDSCAVGILLNNVQSGNGSDSAIVADNIVMGATSVGIQIHGSSFCLIHDNHVSKSAYGIYVSKSTYGGSDSAASNNKLKGNFLIGNTTGIDVADIACSNNTLMENHYSSNATDLTNLGTSTHQLFPDKNDGVWTTPDSMKIGGFLTLGTYTIRQTFSKVGIADNTATAVFRITTANETGSTDAGFYTVKVRALIGHAAVNNVGSLAGQSYEAEFTRFMVAAGTGTNSAVQFQDSTATIGPALGTRGIASTVMTVTETSEYQNDVYFTIDLTGSAVATAEVVCDVTVEWTGFLTAPKLNQL